MQTVENTQGMQWPFAQTGAALNLAGASPDIARYFGAETAGVLPEMQNIFGQQMAQATGNATQTAGGIGADRIGIAQAELANQQGLSAGQTLSQLMGQSVSQAQAGAGLEQQAGTNIANIGTGAQSAALQGATAELQSGTLAQQQLQNQSNAAYENVLQQISWPFQTNQYLGSMAAGVTPAMGGTGITSGNTKSSMMNTSGLGKGLTALGGLGGGLATGGRVASPEDDEDTALHLYGPADEPEPMQAGGFTPYSWDGSGAASAAASTIPSGWSAPTVSPFALGQGNAGAARAQNYGGWMGLNPQQPQPGENPWTALANTAGGQGSASPWFLPMQMMGAMFAPRGSTQFGGNVGKGAASGGRIPHLQEGGIGSFSPASGQTVMVPFGPDFGGPEPLTLTDAGVPPAPNLKPFDLAATLPTQAAGTEGLQLRGSPSFDNPFAGFLSHLMTERAGLMAQLPSGSPGITGQSAAKKQGGGEVNPFGGQESAGLEVGNLLGGNQSGVPSIGAKSVIPVSPVQGRPSPVMKDLMTYKGPNPMSASQMPSGQGAGQNRPQNPNAPTNPLGMLFGQAPNYSQDTPPTPSNLSTPTGGNAFAAPGAGGKVEAPTPTLSPPASTSDIAPPAAFADADLGGDFSIGDLFAAEGGVIRLPPHMDIGGDPFSGDMGTPSPVTGGMGGADPFTPQGEISGSVLPYGIESSIYNQGNQPVAPIGSDPSLSPFQVAGPTLTPSQGEPYGPQMPPGGIPPVLGGNPFNPAGMQGAPGTQGGPQMPVTPAEMEQAQQPYLGRPGWGRGAGLPPPPTREYTPPEPTPPMAIPPTRGDAKHEQLIDKTMELGQKPLTPTPPPSAPPTPNAPPGAGGAGPSGPAAPSQPAGPGGGPSPGVAKAQQLLQQPVSALIKQFPALQPYASMIPDQNMITGPWMQQHPDLAQRFIPYLSQAGITQQDLQAAQRLGPPQAQPQQTPSRDLSWVPQGANPLRYGSVIVPMDASKYAIGRYESGNDYSQVTDSKTNLGRALGRYQVMEGELQRQLKDAGLPPMTPEQFLRDPAAQDKVFERAFGDLQQKYGNFNDAASAWLTGKPLAEAGNRADRFGTTASRYVANTNANLALWVGNKPETQQVAANVPRETTPVAEAPAQRGTDFGPPPGMPKVNQFQRFIGTLVTGDPSFWEKNYAQRTAAYSAISDWGMKRDQLYGQLPSMSPQEGGAALADHVTGPTKNMVGALQGAVEQSGAPGTHTAAAATGQQPPGGGTVTPVGGGPPAPPQPQPPSSGSINASTAGQGLDPALQRALTSPSMAIRSQGLATARQIAETGNIEAQTLLHRMEAARLGWQGQPIGNAIVYPMQGKALVPGRGFVPMEEIFGGAGAAAPGMGGTTPPAAPSTAGPGPSVAPVIPPPIAPSQPPQPIPSGAGPELQPKPAAPAPAAAAPAPATGGRLQDDQRFARTPITYSPGFDWMADRGEVVKEIGTAHAAAQSAQEMQTVIENVKRDAEKISRNRALLPGWIFSERVNIARALNTALQAAGASPIVNPDDLASAQGIEKLQTQLATSSVRGLGREPGYILQMLKSSMVPGGQMTIAGIHNVIGTMEAMNRRALDYSSEKENYASNNGTLRGFEENFAQANPPGKYNRMAEAMGARDDRGRPINPAIINWLRQDPNRAPTFDATFNTPGLANFYLSGAP